MRNLLIITVTELALNALHICAQMDTYSMFSVSSFTLIIDKYCINIDDNFILINYLL